MAQVFWFLGAGVEKGWGPAPPESAYAHFPVQVPTQKSHLRQGHPTPAPLMPDTCAKARAWSHSTIPPQPERRTVFK